MKSDKSETKLWMDQQAMGFMEQYVKFNQNPYSEGAYIGR